MNWSDPDFYISYFATVIYPELLYVFGNVGMELLSLMIVIIAAAAYRHGRSAQVAMRNLEEAQEALLDRCQALDQARAALERKTRAAQEQLDQLMIRQCELEVPSGKTEVKHAIALARVGANTSQLIECGLSHNEAGLIRTLYGTESTA